MNDGHGGTDLYAQASVLNLYDPDRARSFLNQGVETDEAAFGKYLDGLIAAYGGKQGDGLAILMEDDPSPTRERLRAAVTAKLPLTRWCVYEPLGGSKGAAEETAFGTGVRVRPLLEKADVVLSLDCDFLGSAEGTIEGVKGFSKRRRIDQPTEKLSRLYAVENRYTITGGMADHRLRIAASQGGGIRGATGGGDRDGNRGCDADGGDADAGEDQGDGELSRRDGWRSLRRIWWRTGDGRWCWLGRSSRRRCICWRRR